MSRLVQSSLVLLCSSLSGLVYLIIEGGATQGTSGAVQSIAVVNDALEAERQRDQKARRLWREAAERADPDKVARMIAHVSAQAAALPPSYRYR